MESVESYLKKELVKYIQQEVGKGNSVENVKKALVEAGHYHNLVEEAIQSLKKHKWDVIKAMNEPLRNNLQKEIYYDVINAVVRYIEYNLAQGRTIYEIEAALSRFGHTDETIKAAFEIVLDRRKNYKHVNSAPLKVNLRNLIITLSTVAVVILILLLSSSTRTSIGRVFIGLLPTLLTLIFSIMFIHKLKVRSFLTILPFTFVMLFVFAGAFGNFAIFEGLDIKTLALLNLVISMFYVGIIIGTGTDEPEEKHAPSDNKSTNETKPKPVVNTRDDEGY